MFGPPCPSCNSIDTWHMDLDGTHCRCGWPVVTQTTPVPEDDPVPPADVLALHRALQLAVPCLARTINHGDQPWGVQRARRAFTICECAMADVEQQYPNFDFYVNTTA